MYSFIHINKEKIISVLLVICLALFLLVNSIISLRHLVIDDPTLPLNGANIEAFFYVRGASADSSLDSCTCIGDGLISTNETISSDAETVSDNIITSPDYTNYLPKDCTIVWDTITTDNDMYAVIGSVASKIDKVVEPSIREYHQYDNYGDLVKQARNFLQPKYTYYFSTSGNDKYDGLTPDSPKKDPSNYIKNGNCKCLLKSGDVFQSYYGLNVNSNVIISTYGGSERAGITLIRTNIGPVNIHDNTNNIYKVTLDKNSRDVGWLKINNVKSWKKVLSYDSLVNDNEYYVDKANKTIYIKSTSDIEGQTVDYSSNWNGININGKQNVIIENIELANAGTHGIHITTASNVLINNCYIHDIGGAIQDSSKAKFGNGIEIWANACNNVILYKNIVSDCFDAGLTAQISSDQSENCTNLYVINNLVKNCNYGFECFHSSTSKTIKNLIVENNIFYDEKDITGGYRLTQSSTNFTGFLCLWDYSNPNTTISIKNNYGFKTQTNVISYSWKSPVTPPIDFSDNLLVTDKNPAIKNPSLYTGSDDQYEVVESSEEYSLYEKLSSELISNYHFGNICN